jgi:sulfur carrier protein ThiS
MNIEVKLFTILKRYGEGKLGAGNSLQVPDNATVGSIISQLDIPEKLGKITLVNGKPTANGFEVKEGDEIKIFSFIGGG